MILSAASVRSLQKEFGIKDPTNPEDDLDSAVIQLIAQVIADRSGLDENRSIGAAEDVFFRVILPLHPEE